MNASGSRGHSHGTARRDVELLELLDQLHRRRLAADRCEPMACGRHRDPWTCRCSDPPPSELAITGAGAAARHLLAHGLLPLLPVDELRGLWRRGGHEQALARRLHDLTAGRAA
ncbi:hypothetical protein MSAS_22060 [Mycobacterium saskatchewanense]|uniref:hypothetical protein n=1 Tax=Mycobacterium saskatchewanense TaxID=220927 RepID=UPI00138D34DC|nr:hypothetical protein [Mycobacterium saskatchewanense]BBX63032.1 hypothetical protein MSAS_22060 [Mycobacterium saskatchewanense]